MAWVLNKLGLGGAAQADDAAGSTENTSNSRGGARNVLSGDDLPPLGAEFDVARFFQLAHGSRKPGRDPVWVTPEVATGGFATGRHAATLVDGESNAPWMTTEGFFKLSSLLDSGRYRCELPEHAALLAVVWLVRRGDEGAARDVLVEIEPYKGRLRFFPTVLEAAPADENAVFAGESGVAVDADAFQVYRRTAGQARRSLLEVRRRIGGTQCKRDWTLTTQHWHSTKVAPLKAEATELLLKLRTSAPGVTPIVLRAVDAEWCELAADWLRRLEDSVKPFAKLRTTPNAEYLTKRQRCGTVGRFRKFAQKAIENPESYECKPVVGAHILNETLQRLERKGHGADPTKRMRASLRSEPTDVADVARTVAERISRLTGGANPSASAEGGLRAEDVKAVLEPVQAKTTVFDRVVSVPKNVAKQVRLAQRGSLRELAEAGIVPSAEGLAFFLPRLHAAAMTAAYRDVALRRLTGQMHEAFRNRRSLLLLNLESQVRVTEVPWFRALDETAAAAGLVDAELAKRAAAGGLVAVLTAWLSTWPGVIIPNKLVSACKDLVKASELQLDILPELASDIFCDAFAKSFDRAAATAAATMGGTTYSRYYRLDDAAYPTVAGGAAGSLYTAAMAYKKARMGGESSNYVVNNGQVIEAAMVITTHGLAQAVRHHAIGAEVQKTAKHDWAAVARRAFAEILDIMALPDGPWQTRLHRTKRIGYAWRQVVFFVSMIEGEAAQVAAIDALAADVDARHWANAAKIKAALLDNLRAAACGAELPNAVTPFAWSGWKYPAADFRGAPAKAKRGRKENA